MKNDDLEDIFNNTEDLHNQNKTTNLDPPKIEQPSFFSKVKSFSKSMFSRGLTNKKCSATVKQLRVISCHGNEELAPCPHRKDSLKFPGNYFCGACGCGDKKLTLLMGSDSEYTKLDYPSVACPLKMPGFTNYEKDSPDEKYVMERKDYIESLYSSLDMDKILREQIEYAKKLRDEEMNRKEKKEKRREKAKKRIEKIQAKYGIEPEVYLTGEEDKSEDDIAYFVKDPATGKLIAKNSKNEDIRVPPGTQMIELGPDDVENGKVHAKVAGPPNGAKITSQQKSGGCSECAKKRKMAEQRRLEKKMNLSDDTKIDKDKI